MDEKAQKRPHDDGEFDAVIYRSSNGTQGEAGVSLRPFPVPKFRVLLLVLRTQQKDKINNHPLRSNHLKDT